MGYEGLNFVQFITKINHYTLLEEKIRTHTGVYNPKEEYQKYPKSILRNMPDC